MAYFDDNSLNLVVVQGFLVWVATMCSKLLVGFLGSRVRGCTWSMGSFCSVASRSTFQLCSYRDASSCRDPARLTSVLFFLHAYLPRVSPWLLRFVPSYS